jgi:hypothetical protein
MNLPVIKPRTYISPSSFQTWRNCQPQFYHRYLAGHPYQERKQGLAAAVGSAVDALLKDYIAKTRGGVLADRRDLNVDVALAEIILEDGLTMKMVLGIAKPIAKQYIENGFANRFITATHLELNRTVYLQLGGIPLYGILDITMNDEPVDLKVRGFVSKKPPSPTPGYYERFTSRGEKKFPHKLHGQTRMEDHNENWAIQLLWYQWILNQGNQKVHIEEIVKTTAGWDLVRHTSTFSMGFKQKIRKELEHMWETISGLDCIIADPMPDKFKCEKYDTLCDQAAYCGEYQRTLGHPEMRSMFV